MSGVLGSQRIRDRLDEIFVVGTARQENAREASYEMRLADDGLLFGGRWYGVGEKVAGDITIRRGEVAVLSTTERFAMPADLVGTVNIKFKQALKGLILLFGSRVDPKYGCDLRSTDPAWEGQWQKDPYGSSGQRLYLLVCNIGSQDVMLHPGDEVFIVEFHTVEGNVTTPARQNNDTFIANRFSRIGTSGFGFLFGMDDRVAKVEAENQLQRDFRTSQQEFSKLVTYGFVGLLGVTLLGIVLGFFLSAWQMSRPTKTGNEVSVTRSQGDVRIVGVVAKLDANYLLIHPAQADHRLAPGMLLAVLRIGAGGEAQYVATLRVTEVSRDRVAGTVVSRALAPQTGDLVGWRFGASW